MSPISSPCFFNNSVASSKNDHIRFAIKYEAEISRETSAIVPSAVAASTSFFFGIWLIILFLLFNKKKEFAHYYLFASYPFFCLFFICHLFRERKR